MRKWAACEESLSLILKLWTGVFREVRAKPQERNSLKMASPIQFFFSLALFHNVIPGVWVRWLFDVCLIHLRKFRTSLGRALGSLVSLWSWPCSGSGGWQPEQSLPANIILRCYSHTVQTWKYVQDSIAFYSSRYPQLFQTAAAPEGEVGTKSCSCQKGFSALCQQGAMGGDACGCRQ